jgi:beta-mannanase
MWNNSPNLVQFYPGNNYVTWIGLSGYYGTPGMGDYRTFNEIFGPTISDLRGFTHKPIVIAETGATEVSGQMSRWIKEMFRELPAHKGIIGIVWFEAVDVVDWRVASYSQAAAAFSAGYANPLYHVRWSPGMTALLTLSRK